MGLSSFSYFINIFSIFKAIFIFSKIATSEIIVHMLYFTHQRDLVSEIQREILKIYQEYRH